MNKLELLILVLVVGVQVVRALKKRLGGEGLPSATAPEDPEEGTAWREDEGAPEPARREARAAATSQGAPRQESLPPVRPASRPARKTPQAQGSQPSALTGRELLRQRMLGKLILDPPPGAVMLRRFRP